MIREALNQWDFVIASYVVGIGALMVLIVWSWNAMRNAEKRRDEVKRR